MQFKKPTGVAQETTTASAAFTLYRGYRHCIERVHRVQVLHEHQEMDIALTNGLK